MKNLSGRTAHFTDSVITTDDQNFKPVWGGESIPGLPGL